MWTTIILSLVLVLVLASMTLSGVAALNMKKNNPKDVYTYNVASTSTSALAVILLIVALIVYFSSTRKKSSD